MRLLDVARRQPPQAWAEGDNIPWDEPGFSERMLREHLSQAHDHASRRLEKIERHVAWIHEELLGGKRARVLDLACGPGLYASRLAGRGCQCVGLDFSPAAIAYARSEAELAHLDCTYHHVDLRAGAYGSGFDLAMLLFGQANVFRPRELRLILDAARAALRPGGLLLLEPQSLDSLRAEGQAGPSWAASAAGLFSDRPHLLLKEHAWDEAAGVATTRFYVVDATDASVERHALSSQAYAPGELEGLLRECSFVPVARYGSLAEIEPPGHAFYALTARAE